MKNKILKEVLNNFLTSAILIASIIMFIMNGLENIAVLITIAYLTYLIELPVMSSRLSEVINFDYIKGVTLLINLLTNILMNGVIYLILNEIIYGSFLVILISELFIVILECLMFSYAFCDYEEKCIDGKRIRNIIISKVIIANVKSFIIGYIILTVISELYYFYI